MIMFLIYTYCIFIFLLFSWIFLIKFPKKPHEVIPYLKGAVQIYNDEKSSKIFSSKKYKINAKPDFIYKLGDEYILVEYKSRDSRVKDSDVWQLIATALAVKETYENIKVGFIYTNSGDIKEINLNKKNDVLATIIEEELNYVRAIEDKRHLPFIPQKIKCTACHYRQICHYSVA